MSCGKVSVVAANVGQVSMPPNASRCCEDRFIQEFPHKSQEHVTRKPSAYYYQTLLTRFVLRHAPDDLEPRGELRNDCKAGGHEAMAAYGRCFVRSP